MSTNQTKSKQAFPLFLVMFFVYVIESSSIIERQVKNLMNDKKKEVN